MPHVVAADRVSMQEFWPLDSDPVKVEPDNDELLDFLAQVKQAYGRGN